jgi:hypothetical protein
MSNIKFDDREAWLTEAANLMLDDILMPAVERKGYTYERPKFRISIVFPKHSRGGKAIAVCFAKAASTDGVNEIFINPEIDEPTRVLDAMAHELIHAVDDCQSGHRNFFAKLAREIGLEGPFTATYAGEDLRGVLESYSVLLGEFPHSRMNTSKVHKKDGTRQRKVTCDHEECGFLFRTSAAQIKKLGHPGNSPCPACNNGYLTWEV